MGKIGNVLPNQCSRTTSAGVKGKIIDKLTKVRYKK